MHDLTLQMDDNPLNLETVLQILRFRQFDLQRLSVRRENSGAVSVCLSVTVQTEAQPEHVQQLVTQLAKRPGIYSVNVA